MIQIKKSVLALILVCAVLVGGVAVIFLGDCGLLGSVLLTSEEYQDYTYLSDTYGKLDYILGFIEENYYVEVDADALLEEACYGLVEGLGDKYSEYIGGDEYESLLASLTGDYSGIGMTFSYNIYNELVVVSVMEDTPAERAGLLPGDIILAVDGVYYTGDDINTVGNTIRGTAGTDVTLLIRRDGEDKSYTITREHIVSKTVKYEMLEGNIGYINISSFESSTEDDFVLALENLEAKDAVGLIIDLRDNGGGLVSSAVSVADELMGKATMVYAEDQYGERIYYKTEDGATELPYVILVNENTASASEMLAAGVQDNNAGVIVGTKTFGKGIIQSIWDLPFSDGCAIKLTTMQYYSPSGTAIHGIGVTPDYIVEDAEDGETDSQLDKALELLRQ